VCAAVVSEEGVSGGDVYEVKTGSWWGLNVCCSGGEAACELEGMT
jgi:hypothetical protein